MAARAMAWAAAQAGDRVRAERALGRAWQVAQVRDSAHERAVTRWHAARVAWHFDDLAQARQWLDPAEAAFESMAMRWHLDQARALRRLTG
jgi:hypothetical protein